MPISFPPVNSIISASEGRRVSALYSALTDTPAAAARRRRSVNGGASSASEPSRSVSSEERISEDYRALLAIRQFEMTFEQIKALLDEQRMKASKSVSHAHGTGKGKARAIR